MAENRPQTYENHTKFVPLFHYIATPLLLANLLWALYRAATGFSIDALFGVVVAFGLILVGLFSRTFALSAQDRVIRLEPTAPLRRIPEPTPRIAVTDSPSM